MPKPTIKDVAEKAGVSDATVSRALNGLGSVRPQTREKVEQAASELHFVLSKSASALSSGKTKRIEFLSNAPLDTWFNSSALQGSYETLSPQGYEIIPQMLDQRSDLEYFFEKIPLNPNMDGVIIVSFSLTRQEQEQLKHSNIPVVGINTPVSTGLSASARIDNRASMMDVVSALQSLHHEHIAFVLYSTQSQLVDSGQRSEAFLQAALSLGYSRKNLTIIDVSSPDGTNQNQAEKMQHALSQLATLSPMPTAICCEADDFAISLIKQLRHQGFNIPKDISVIGFDDNAMARIMNLTTVRQNPKRLAQIAATSLIDLLQGKTLENPYTVVPTQLILRDTTAICPESKISANT